MLILALDTTTAAGSTAVLRDGRVLAEQTGDAARTHAARLPRELMTALDAAGARLADVDRLAVASGPGSFTGLRVGIAAMQGLALARGLQIAPISALEALAWPLRGGATLIAPWMDARRREVFAALYDRDGRTLRHAPTALGPERTLETWLEAALSARGERITFTGDATAASRDIIARRLGERAVILPDAAPLAGTIAQMAYAMPERAVNPHAVVPLYVRRPDAELARERRR